jgi:O-antigen/teichoic acid export membrane protein
MINQKRLKEKSIFGFLWKLVERSSTQIVQLAISIVIARILGPTTYAEVAILLVFVSIANVFSQGGLNSALIQDKSADKNDYTAIMIASLLTSLFVYIILFFVAPYIESYYELENFITKFRVFNLSILFSTFMALEIAYVSKKLLFKPFAIVSIISLIISGTLAIVLAILDFGSWSMIIYYLLNQLLITLLMLFVVKIPFGRDVNYKRLLKFYNFGWKIMLSRLLSSIHSNIRSLVIGKFYSLDQLSFYDRGKKFPDTLYKNLDQTIISIMFPLYSHFQDDFGKLLLVFRRSMKLSLYVMTPMLLILAILSKEIVLLLLGDEWLGASVFVVILSYTFLFSPIQTSLRQAINSIGKSGVNLFLSILSKILSLFLLFLSIVYFEGVVYVALSGLLASVITTIIYLLVSKRIFHYKILTQIKDIVPIFIVAISSFLFTNIVKIYFDNFHDIITIILVPLVYGLIYLSLSAILKVDSLSYLIEIIMDLKHSYFKKGIERND